MARVKFDYDKASDVVFSPLQKKLIGIGFLIEKKAKRFCPVDTGRLRASISTNWSNSGMGRGVVGNEAKEEDGIGNPRTDKGKFVVVIGTNVKYAPFIEFGTSKMGNTPFMRAAFEQYRDIAKKLAGSLNSIETE